MKPSACIGALLCAAILLCVAVAQARADIARHCTGWISARILSGVDKNGNNFTMGMHRSQIAVELSGRGTCRGRAWANECRRRARDAVIRCASGLWQARWQRRVPPDVCESASNSRPPHAGVTAWSSNRNDIKRGLEYAACCKVFPDTRFLNFAVILTVHGDTGCWHQRDLEPIYKADCAALRKQGLCAKRTSG